MVISSVKSGLTTGPPSPPIAPDDLPGWPAPVRRSGLGGTASSKRMPENGALPVAAAPAGMLLAEGHDRSIRGRSFNSLVLRNFLSNCFGSLSWSSVAEY